MLPHSELTADIIDDFGHLCQSCPVQLRTFGLKKVFNGRIRTISCRDDNVLIRRLMTMHSLGEVLVVDGGDSLSSALMGDAIADLGRSHGWSGIIIFGAVRDVAALARADFGIKALGSNPRKSGKTGSGTIDQVIEKAGTTFTPGHWLYCDEDGILVTPNKLF